MTYPVALRFEGKLGLVFGGRGMGATGGTPNPFPGSWINQDGTINCSGIVYCAQPIPCEA